MLIKYKSDYQKITMGLLSYISDLKETSRLTNEMEWYSQEDNRQLFLWKSDETGDMAGVIGIEEEDEVIILRHISINPSYRDEGMSYQMIESLSEKFQPKKIVGTLDTATLVTKWQKSSDDSINE